MGNGPSNHTLLQKLDLKNREKIKQKAGKMGLRLSFLATAFLVLLLAFLSNADTIIPLEKFGPVNPGSDITQVLASAWKEACGSVSTSVLEIPKGVYKVSEGKFKGPCKSPIHFQVKGTLQAPTAPNGDSWITFSYIDRLTLSGGGVFDGQGKAGWDKNNCNKKANCDALPISLRFNFITNSTVESITSLDSKNFHINVLGCNNLTFQGVNVTAPENSPNTDGIHIGRSNKIFILNSHIATGDDCISLGDGSRVVRVSDVTCGPGHGISIGSLGRYTMEEPVEDVIVKHCTLTNTLNGVRIKTWPASPAAGTATDMHFEDIIMVNVSNPVLIDQEYCPWNQCNPQIPSKVEISKVSFKNIRGSSATAVAVKFVCSKGAPCSEVEVADIDLSYNGREGPITSQCSNVKPIISGKQDPRICSSPYVPP